MCSHHEAIKRDLKFKTVTKSIILFFIGPRFADKLDLNEPEPSRHQSLQRNPNMTVGDLRERIKNIKMNHKI